MAQLAPPRPNRVLPVTYDDGLRRVHFRLWQILMTAVTVLMTGWFVSFGLLPAILALMVAKHVLVAIVAVGLHMPEPPNPCAGPPTEGA